MVLLTEPFANNLCYEIKIPSSDKTITRIETEFHMVALRRKPNSYVNHQTLHMMSLAQILYIYYIIYFQKYISSICPIAYAYTSIIIATV